MSDQIDEFTRPLIEAVANLRAENVRLKALADAKWQAESRAHELTTENSRLKRELEKKTMESEQRWCDLIFWKKAVRYEQALKRPRKMIRHLPIFNEIRRAARRDGPNWMGTRTNPERLFLREWRKENKRVPGLNCGRGILEILMSEDNDSCADLTQRDATVAATVIQWLGTNCGYAFIHKVEHQIKQSREKERAEQKLQ